MEFTVTSRIDSSDGSRAVSYAAMPSLSALPILLAFTLTGTAIDIDGRVVDSHSDAPIAGAVIAIVGQRGSVTTDSAGRFRWQAIPPLPADVIITLPGGRVARLADRDHHRAHRGEPAL